MPKPSGPKPSVSRHRTRQYDDDSLPHPTGDATISVEPPDDLTDAAREVWDATVPSLARMGALTEGDLPMLAEFVGTLALARAARQEYERLAALGTVDFIDRNGGEHTVTFLGSQEAKRLRSDYTAFLKVADSLAAQFGLTPTARARLGLTVIRATSLREALASVFGDEAAA